MSTVLFTFHSNSLFFTFILTVIRTTKSFRELSNPNFRKEVIKVVIPIYFGGRICVLQSNKFSSNWRDLHVKTLQIALP
jgi:hypothetical protein